jgi:hypothetical protein
VLGGFDPSNTKFGFPLINTGFKWTMSQTLQLVIELVARQDVMISDHGYDELAEDGILITDVIAGVTDAVMIEDYPEYHKGPCVLVLQKDHQGQPLHVVWGIPKNAASPAVVVTAYRPDVEQWTEDFMRRKP